MIAKLANFSLWSEFAVHIDSKLINVCNFHMANSLECQPHWKLYVGKLMELSNIKK